MKKIISISFSLLLLIGCSKDSDSTEERLHNNVPEPFTLLTPTEGAINDVYDITFEWEAALDQDGDRVTYDLYLSQGEGPMTRVASDITGTSYVLEGKFDYNSSNSWHVRASDGKQGGETISTNSNFTTRKPALEKILDDNSYASFSPKRSAYTGLYFNDKFYIISGYGEQTLGDVWSSGNYGRQWTFENDLIDTGFERYGHSSVVFNDRMWVIGGHDDTKPLGTIYSSGDGVDWIEEEFVGSFGQRYDHTSVVFNDKIWIIGGYDDRDAYFDDVMSWTGISQEAWVMVASGVQTPFNGIRGHSGLVFDDKIWIIGGREISGEYVNTVWYTSNGINWTQAQDLPLGLAYHKSAVFDGKIWVIGGEAESGVSDNIYYYDLSTGEWNYHDETFPEDFGARYNHSVIAIDEGSPNDGIYIFGSFNGTNYFNDVWKLN